MSLYYGNWEEGIARLGNHNSWSRIFYLMDQNVRRLYPQLSAYAPQYTFVAKEEHKSLSNAESLWHWLLEEKVDRQSCLVSIGGGCTTDLGGFVASTILRGIDSVHIPTSLLGMVDAAIGGKTAINLYGIKNQIGSMHEPKAVCIDSHFLSTLPEKEWRNGLAECMKHALISDPLLWEEMMGLSSFDALRQMLVTQIARFVDIKVDMVSADYKEQGVRKSLNVGHTIGHSIERWSAQKGTAISHGHAVAVGISIECEISYLEGLLSPKDKKQIQTWVSQWYPQIDLRSEDIPELCVGMAYDKKNQADNINFSLLREPGRVSIDCFPERKTIELAIKSYVKG